MAFRAIASAAQAATAAAAAPFSAFASEARSTSHCVFCTELVTRSCLSASCREPSSLRMEAIGGRARRLGLPLLLAREGPLGARPLGLALGDAVLAGPQLGLARLELVLLAAEAVLQRLSRDPGELQVLCGVLELLAEALELQLQLLVLLKWDLAILAGRALEGALARHLDVQDHRGDPPAAMALPTAAVDHRGPCPRRLRRTGPTRRRLEPEA
mmetsp:Transcript_53676/g.157972  ORF Transcript_53676/g.157972 Transcript_53676/m.157972 type:complete len:214 (-) Transcript_53676:9-650(-)